MKPDKHKIQERKRRKKVLKMKKKNCLKKQESNI